MNSKDYRNIRESYLQVYAPQELTEEQVWEEVEYWVNSLLEEGYDLSDCTWEEMYESYLSEGLLDDVKTDMRDAAAQKTVNKALSGGLKTATPTTQRPATPTRPSATPTQRPTATPTRPSATPTQRPTATSAASGPKSTPTTPTTPTAPTKPAIGTTPGGTKFERRTPTSAELSAAQDARSAGKGEEGAIKAGVEASKPATPAPNPVKADVPGFALGGKQTEPKKTPITSGFDMFDAVKGYLIGEGYADTEEAALVIMANMSEEWRESIVEAFVDPENDTLPSGETPLQKVSGHPNPSVRRKAVKGMRKQMEIEYGGKFKAKSKDPTRDD